MRNWWIKYMAYQAHFWSGNCAERISAIDTKIQELEHRLETRLAKLEKIERIATNVARERAKRPKNWTQFRALAEGIEEPNAHRQS